MNSQTHHHKFPLSAPKTPDAHRLDLSSEKQFTRHSPSASLMSPGSPSPPPSTAPINYTDALVRRHHFVRYAKDGSQTELIVHFSENLLELILEKTESKMRAIPIEDLIRIEVGFSKHMMAVLIRTVNHARVYGFRVLLSNKTLEMSCSSRK